jgi:hypothetical protein
VVSVGKGAVTAGTYTLAATDNGQGSPVVLEANFTLAPNTAVATVTLTETSTTQGSQATTTYAIPTTSCTLLGGTETIQTTITVGPTPPTSTTTTTMTTTSTSYTQTVTVTSCTYSAQTVTSTVTTTATP